MSCQSAPDPEGGYYKKPYRQGRTDHSRTWALPEDLGSVGGPMKCPWYLL
ncbi:unnamed protein product [Staurois parvus]|uniref:Uncharacterized protein n=1 Tax=Staurois parvus TaxID=386267 RepID=A0ABN9C6L9_9NEOB|nr:unnamed protein product [Staurois parvus]